MKFNVTKSYYTLTTFQTLRTQNEKDIVQTDKKWKKVEYNLRNNKIDAQ